jgi:methylthioribose-1-phosphate isomerase
MRCIEWKEDHVEIIDQTRLPACLEIISCRDVPALGEAIKRLAIRGAPALGVAAAMGMALSALKWDGDREGLLSRLEETKKYLASLRPTAVNLFWALERMMEKARAYPGPVSDLKGALRDEALLIFEEDAEKCRRIGDFGASLAGGNFRILHHCNTGFLATGDYGTALGVIRSAHRQGKNIHVFVDETRPLLQGSRLTAWELAQDGIPYTLIADNMAGWLMAKGRVDMAIVGADRITAQGDAANKIGTYSVAVLARHHGIPFYVAAPTTTIDLSTATGEEIEIEERKKEELLYFQGVQSAPLQSDVYNPAFDVTPASLITAIITEEGIARPPYGESLARMCRKGAGLPL